ncbi:DUF2537 domain-containing protein [Tsukamurella sp. 1534]|uniref:DUF2537 domain-containing protein n=1 Tax=Tsukamurella sp. 1534 TaxID=1151061 RepID=UPI0002EBDAF9|nr:DUF2537 domain-containing protein [Tsukamurella sp. 1534]
MRYTPVYAGTAVAVLVAGLTGIVLTVLFLAVMLVNVLLGFGLLALGTAGAAPVLVAYRRAPVGRWFCAGVTGGLVVTWLSVIAVTASGAFG